VTQQCPTDEQWERFYQGDVSAEQADARRAHLSACQRCRRRTRRQYENLALLDDLRVVMQRTAAEPAADPLAQRYARGARVGPYEIQDLLGVGGMSKVYRAVHAETGLVVALKVLKGEYQASPEIQARFAREARTLAQIQHPNIVRIYPPESKRHARDQICIAMELLTGGSLADWIAQQRDEGKLPDLAAALTMSLQAARGLGAAHAQGLVHRDVKPSNLLLDENGRVKVTDFGVVQALESTTWVTGTGQHIGTPAYMSPEQCKGERATPGSDVYSLGATMFELATGRLPFTVEGGSPFAQMLKHISEPTPDPRDINPSVSGRFAAVISQCLEKNPADRFPDSDALSAALEQAAKPEPKPARPTPVTPGKTALSINTRAVREQLERLPQRSIVAWACRCARQVQRFTSDPRVSRALEMAESAAAATDEAADQRTSARVLTRMQRLRAASLAAAYADADMKSAAVTAARAAAAASACAAARCVADAAADAVFALENALIACRLGGTSASACWRDAQKDFRRLYAAKLGAPGTIGLPVPPDLWDTKT
jgi:serine/threonine protein kinase